MLKPLYLRSILTAALIVAAGPAVAQTFPTIRPGQPVQASLGESDPAFVERGRFRAYRFDAVAGQTYLLTLRSDAFDSFLFIAWTVGGLTEVLAANDDSGEGTDARLRWRAPATGSYVVVAQSLTAEGRGPFALEVDRAPQPTTAAPRAIRIGETAQGDLAETDAVDEDDDSFYDSYTLRGTRGQRLRIEMHSDSFDTFLSFGQGMGDGWVATDTDDDGHGESTDSRLLVTLPEDGEYVIRANSVGAAATGPYTLTVAERQPAGTPVAAAITAGAEVTAALAEGDAETADGALFDLYRYTGRAGERVSIRLSADRFDTFLVFGRLDGGQFQELSSNDDAGGSTDSALELTLPADGDYGIRAQALVPGANGSYRLRIESTR